MSKRGFGLVLVLLLSFAAAGGALYQDFLLDAQIAGERASAEAIARRLQSAQLALANLRGAQAAYFAVGQGPDFWRSRASDLAADIELAISDLQATTTSTAAARSYEAAMSALGGLNSLDQRARDDLDDGASRLAADAVFSDATASAERLSAELSTARAEEAMAHEARIGELRQWRIRVEAAGLGGLLVAVLALAIARRQPPAEDAPVEVERLTPAVVEVEMEPERAREAPVAVPPPVTPPGPDLSEAAQVCVDLARVLDGQDIPPLLERAARVLDARGLVLWVSDGSGALLRPSLAHGYPDRVLQRLRPLQIDADNVTSLAFRSMQAQTLTHGTGAGNALAVPLITPSGCIGVLAAEVGAAGGATVSVARMFAAQLSTIVTPASASAERTAQA